MNNQLLSYSFIDEDKQSNRIKQIIHQVKEKIGKPDIKLIEQMKSDKEFFSSKKFITSDKALERLSQLINAIKYKIPIIEEGPTGTSKTFTTLIAIDYLNYRKQKENPNDKKSIKELLRFNLSSQTRSDDLLCQIAGDPDSPSGLKTIDGVFLRAFRDGYPLLLDEINLANESVLQFLLEAISSGILSIIINGKGLQEIRMHEDFCLIATQNPPTGMFTGKRNNFSIDFLSKFSKVKFDIDLEELKQITIGSAKEFNYNNEKVIEEMVKFHEKWVKEYVKEDDVQCFTIRDILATIKLISEDKGIFESIYSIYGARYPKEIKMKLQQVLQEFPKLYQKVENNKVILDENFSFSYTNEIFINVVNQCIFSLENGRNIIISGNEGCGKSYLAKMIAKFYNSKHFEKEKLNSFTNYCICTNKLECSDLLGSQKPSDKIQESEEMLVWKNGFLTDGIINGLTIVLDNINEAPSTVTERLNGLLDKTYDNKEAHFELPENPNDLKPIKINKNFRIICVCQYEKIKKMSPAFINRFDVIVLDDLFDKNVSDKELKKLIAITLIKKSFNQPEIIEEEEQQMSESEDLGEAYSDDDNLFKFNGNEEGQGDNEIEKEKSEYINDEDDYSKEESKISEKSEEKQNSNNQDSSSFNIENKNNYGISSINLQKIKLNSDEKDINYELTKEMKRFLEKEENKKFFEETIKSIRKIENFSIHNITKFINSIYRIYLIIEKEKRNIGIDIIVNFVYDLIFNKEKNIEKINIDPKILEFFDEKLDEKNGNDENDDKYHFKESESLKKFMVFLLASSYINLHLCVIGPPGGGKTTSARAFSRIRGKILDQSEAPFRMYTFNEGTKPHDFYGSSTLNRGKIKFNYGALSQAIKDGSVFIADEFNLTSIETMRSIIPVLEHNFNKKNRIPGIEGPIIFNDKFFFIICQNESITLGRNLMPKELDNRLRTIFYPPANKNDIQEICKNINKDINDSFNVSKYDRMKEEFAEKCGEYMIELNNLKLRILSPWSLRDIHKLFSRIANIHKKKSMFFNIDILENILFYTMSPVTKENEERILDDIINLLVDIFSNEDNKPILKDYLKNLYLCDAKIKSESFFIDKKKTVKIKLIKDKCEIELESLEYSEDGKKDHNISERIAQLENLNKLPKFLNSLFKLNLSFKNEPILLSGNTSYKKELAKEFLKSASFISLNQEITINQLLGSSSFLNKEDSKYFYLKELCKCLKITNLPIYMNYLKHWLEIKKSGKLEECEEKKLKLKDEIDKIRNDILRDEKYPFRIAIENLYNKLFEINLQNENSNNNNLLSDMVIEFRPGLIFSAILGQHSLILGDLPNAKTVVLERFNELISGKHSLTLNEDIHETFTSVKEKEFSNFNDFRIIATCKKGYENRLSEALLSRFTIICIENYSQEEQREVLNIKVKGKKMENDINKLINYSKEFQDKFKIEFPLTKMVKCLDLYEQFVKNNNKIEIFFPFYILANGLLEKRNEINIQKLVEIENNFKISKNKNLEIIENIYLSSQFTKLRIFSGIIRIPKNHDEIYFSEKMKEMINILHAGLCTKSPVILEGFSEQGKSTAIKYLADYLNLEIINVNISKETKVEDLLCQISIEKEENDIIKIKNNETKLLKALKSQEQFPKSIIVFQNLNNASPAVLETLTSIFGPINTNILLPNGDTFQKGEAYIISIFNRQNGVSREKLPSSLIHNSLYYVVENPDNDDIKKIIKTLFEKYNLEEEIDSFEKYFFESKKIISEKNNDSYLTLSDIKKYILFRKKCPKVNTFIIIQFIFIYRFYKLELIEESKKRLGLIDLTFDPEIEYTNEAKNLKIKLIQGERESYIEAKTFDNELINKDIENIINSFNNITIYGKYALIFLICSVLTKRACILQGENCSGKTFLIRFLAKMFGRKLIEYQMNSDVGMSLFTRDSIINKSLSTKDKRKLGELILQVKDLLKLDEKDYVDVSNLSVPQYKKIIKEINSKILNLKDKDKNNLELLIKVKKQISLIISPVNQLQYKESDFIRALREGEWVLIDGIESAPNQIIEKLISLCGDNPELNIYETGKGIYFNKNGGDNIEKIHENFHLFITCNPSKEAAKKIDKSLFSKCMTFTSPQIDSKVEDGALVLFSRLRNYNNDDINILLNLSSRLSSFHNFCLKESQKNPFNFAGRIPITPNYLLFISNIFNNSKNESYDNKIYYSLDNYWKSVSNDSIKQDFQHNSLIKFLDEPFELKTKQTLIEKLKDILIIIKNAQIIILNNENISNFHFEKLVIEILNLKLNEIDIENIIKYLNETLEMLSESNKSHSYFGKIKQIKIIVDLLTEIKSAFLKNEIEPQFYNMNLNADEIDKIKPIEKPIKLLKLLKQLLINKNIYNQNIKIFIFDSNFEQLLNLVTNFIKNQNRNSFHYLIEFLHNKKKQKLINALNDIFPYNNKNITDYSKKLIYVTYLLDKKSINFIFKIDNKSYIFNYEEKFENKLIPTMIISKDFYFDLDTKIGCKNASWQIKIEKNGNFKPDLKTSKIFLQMIEHFASVVNITQSELKKMLKKIMKNDKTIIIPKNNFILKNLFNKDENSPKISKVWALMFNFYKEKKFFNYLKSYLSPIESELLKIIEAQINNIDKTSVDKIIGLTNQLISFCDENSILWQDSLEEFKIINSETQNHLIEINIEIDNLEKLSNKLNINLTPYIGRLKEIKAELNKGNKHNEQMEKARTKINSLKDKLNQYLNNGKFNQYHRVIGKLKTKIINSYEESEEYILKLESETNDLLKTVDYNLSHFLESKQLWPMIKTENYLDNPEVILFKNLIWYSKIKEVILEIKREQNIGIKRSLIPKIEQYGEIKTILDYIEFKLDDSNISFDDYNFIESHLRNLFLLKLYKENSSNDIIDIEYINFEKQINNLISRYNTNENLYKYFCNISNDLCPFESKFNLIIPKFKPIDLIYLFISKTSRGCKNDLLLKDFPNISNEKLEKLLDDKDNKYLELMIKIITILLKEKFMRDDIKIQNYNEIMKYIQDNEKDKFSIQLSIALKIAMLLDKKSSKEKENLRTDDLLFFSENIKNRYNYFITNKNIASNYPSLLFYFCKYKNKTNLLLQKIENEKNLQNSILNKDNYNEDIIPFWLLCLRVLSSFHIIDYDFKRINYKDSIVFYIKTILKEKVKGGKTINSKWLNLVLEDIPKEISQSSIGMYYNFFNNINNSIITDNKYLKDLIEQLIRKFHKEVIISVFNNESKLPIYIDFSDMSELQNLKNMMIDPNNYILQQIQKELNEILKKNFSNINEINELNNKLKTFLQNFNSILKKLTDRIIFENEIGKNLYKQKIKKDNEECLNNELDEKKKYQRFYKEHYEILEKNLQPRHNMISVEDKNIIKLNSDLIKKLEEEHKYLEKYKDIYKFGEKYLKVTKVSYKYKRILNGDARKIYMKIRKLYYNGMKLEDEIYFNDINEKDIEEIGIEASGTNNISKIINFNNDLKNNLEQIKFYELLPLEEDKIIYEKIKIKNKPQKQSQELNIPKVTFNGLTEEDYVSKLKKFNKKLIDLKYILENIKKEFIDKNYCSLVNKIKDLIKELKENNHATIDGKPCDSLNEIIKAMEKDIREIDIKIEKFEKIYQSNYKHKLIALYKLLDEKKVFDKSFELKIPSEHNQISNFQFNLEGLKEVDLSMPFISYDNEKNNFEFSNKTFEKIIGPLYPSLCGELIEIKILNSIKNKVIYTSIEDINSIDKKDIKMAKESLKENDKLNVKINDKIDNGNDLILKIRIPELFSDQEETHYYSFNLNLKLEQMSGMLINLTIPCKIYIKLIPFTLKLMSENYNLKFINNKKFKLNTDLIYEKEKLTFKIENLMGDKLIEFQTKIESLEENELINEPCLNKDINDGKIELIIPNVNKDFDNYSKFHGILTIAFTEQYKIEIEIKATIVPIIMNLNIYDYAKKKYAESPTIYFSDNSVKKDNFIIPIYLRVESVFCFKPVKFNLEWEIDDENIELKEKSKTEHLKENQVILLYLTLKKNFFLKYEKKRISLKLKGLELLYEKCIDFFLKEGEKPSENNIINLSEEFDFYSYDKNINKFILENDIDDLFNNKSKKLNKSILYTFGYIKNAIEYINFQKLSKPNDNRYKVYHDEGIVSNIYYHINSNGKITKKSSTNPESQPLYYYNFESTILLFTIFEFSQKYIFLDFFGDIEETIFDDWTDDNIGSDIKLRKIDELLNLKNDIKKKFKKNENSIDFSDFAYFIIKNENIFEELGEEIYKVFTDKEKEEYNSIKLRKGNDKKEYLLENYYYNIICFFYKFFKTNRDKYKNKRYIEFDVEESKLESEMENLQKNYYIYENKKNKEIDRNISQIIEQLKKYQKEPYEEMKENIYIIYEKQNPQIYKGENIKKNEQNYIETKGENKDIFNIEPPDFKSDINFNMKFNNIMEIIDFYIKYTSDTNILPLHIIKLIYNKNLTQTEKKELNKNLENRFVKMIMSYNDLEFINEDKCLIYKIIQDFKEAMNDMLLKFEKGKTNFKELIPKINLNQKILNKAYEIEEKPKFKLDIKQWKFKNIKDYNLYSSNKLLGFQFLPKKDKNIEERISLNNFGENEIEDIDIEQNNKKEIKKENKKSERKITTIDSKHLEEKGIEYEEKYIENPIPKEKNGIDIKNEDKSIENEKPKKTIKALKFSTEDQKEIKNLNKPLDMNPNIPESEINDQIQRIIEQMKDLDINSDFKLENAPTIKYNISEYIIDQNNNINNELEKIIQISWPISTGIISEISKKNLKEYIPFNNLEVNLLVDCSRYISNEAKYFNVILFCGIANALNALKIRYSIGLVADYQFKIELKTVDNPHNNKYLQMVLDCIYCDRLLTRYASCINYAIEKFQTKNKINSDRVFIMISNGLDKELKLRKKWEEKFFNNIKHSFLFLFTEPKFKDEKIIQFLREEIWGPFKAHKDINYTSIVKVMHFEQKINKEFIEDLSKNIFACLSRKLDEEELNNYIKNFININPKFEFEKEQLSNEHMEKMISSIEKEILNDYSKFKEPYIKKIEQIYNNIDIRQGEINVQLYSKYQNKILENKYPTKIIEKIEFFTKKFKEKKENLNLSSLELIFQPNLPTQYVLSTKGNIIDMDAFFKYYLNPTPNPMFYKELDGGFIKNYGITLVIDTSISCINSFTYDHYFDTIRVLLSILSYAELPSFDLVVTGVQAPIVICSDLSTSIALNEKSSLWGSLYASLTPIDNADLASAMKVAYDLSNIRRNESTNYIFVITDGLFSIPEQKVILEKVKMCENKGINVFGIGIGISPFGLENLFSHIIFSQNPYHLIDAIGGFFTQINCHYKEMPRTTIFADIKDYRPSNETFKEIKEKPEYYKLKEYLQKFLFIPESIPLYNEEDEVDLDQSLAHKENVILKPSYSKNCLKGQKLLIVMLWSHEMDITESESIDEKYIKEPYKEARTCIKDLLDEFGVDITIVKNYKDAINELTTEDEELKGKCKYFAAMVMNGPNFAVLPKDDKIRNEEEEARYIKQFLKVLKMFWENGGGILLFNENEPFFFQTNLFLEMLEFPGPHKKANFKLGGNHKGGKEIKANNEGDLSNFGTFTRKRTVVDNYQRSIIGHGLVSINEGITLSYTDYDEEKVKPFYIFSRDNEGGVNSLYYIGTEGRGDIIIDNSYTKFLSDLKNLCTAKLVQNMVAWIARIDYCLYTGQDPKLVRPKLIDYKFNPDDKCEKTIFAKKKKKRDEADKLKTLIAIDLSGSTKGKDNYHQYIKDKILKNHYNKNRGDAIYLWSSNYSKKSYEEIIKIIDIKYGNGGTMSSLIAKILDLEKNNDFKHLVIVTDGKVDKNEILNSDKYMKSIINNIKLEFISTYIIDTGENVDLSVGAPYCREFANNTIYIDKNNGEHVQPSLFQEDLDEWKKLVNLNYTKNDFLKNYSRIENAVKAETLGSSSESALEALTKFKKKINENQDSDFINKIEKLIKLAKEGYMDFSIKVT